MPTMTEAAMQTQTRSQVQNPQPSPLDKAFASAMMNQRWNPEQHPYMYSMMYGDYDMLSLPGLVNVAAGKVDKNLRKFSSLGMSWINSLDGMGGPNSNPQSELDQLNQQLITYGNNGRRTRPKNKEIDQLIEQALHYEKMLQQTKEDQFTKPDIASAQKLASQSKVKPKDRVLGANLDSTRGLIAEINNIFNNSLDPEVKADVAHMNNQALPGERELKEQQYREREDRER